MERVNRSIKDILNYIIPPLLEKGIVNNDDPVLHIRISGDGRNVGHKVKHVMVTFVLLNDYMNIYHPDHQYSYALSWYRNIYQFKDNFGSINRRFK